MEQSQETFDQKVIRNVKAGGFAVYKTPEVVGGNTNLSNIEWEDPESVDTFFAFAKNLGARVLYVSEAEEEDESGQSKTSIVQVGFLHGNVMHHINLVDADEEEDDEDEDEEEDEEDYDEEDDESYEEDESEEEDDEDEDEEEDETEVPSQPTSQPQQTFGQPAPSNQEQQPSWPRPNY